MHADAVCSLIVVTCILWSALPLLADSSTLLLLRVADGLSASATNGGTAGAKFDACVSTLRALPGVRVISDCTFWQHCHRRALGTLTVTAVPNVCERQLADDVARVLRSYGVEALAVQVERAREI